MALRKPKPLIHFEMYWHRILLPASGDAPTQGDWRVNIRIWQSSDITWSNTQGYKDKTDAMRAIDSLLNAIDPGQKITNPAHIKISGPGKKPA